MLGNFKDLFSLR